MLDELEFIIDSYHVIKKFKNQSLTKGESILQYQKSDHEIAPMMIENSIELKINIIDKALDYGIYGDIELDQGYSFAYQITIFFPTYFQRQIIKSQFSLYDAFAGENQDQNNVQKRNLQNMVKIDTNIFRDISTTQNNIPTQESLHQDAGFENIKVIRLKSSAYWIDYVIVYPKIPACLQKQAAFLSTNNPIDSLLRSAINFLDVNDLATANRILEETSRLHQQSQKDKFQGMKSNKKKKSFVKQPNSDGPQKPNQQDESSNVRDHFMSALIGDISKEQTDPLKSMPNVNINTLRYMPQHLIHAYYILRHMKSRDYKLKLLYCLNYFRSIQKRVMLDLREFGTRERIIGDLVQPIIPAEEADKVSQQNANANYFKFMQDQQQIGKKMGVSSVLNDIGINTSSGQMQDRSGAFYQKAEKDFNNEKEYSVFKDGQLRKEETMLDMKQYKYKGKFCNKIFSTCPVIPRFHATFGEPIEQQPLNVEMERIGAIKHATDEGVKLMGRVDHIEIDKKTLEVYVKDDFGIYILYECTLQDMKDIEEELLKTGSYYISKHEFLVNSENEKPYPVIDRITLIEDLLMKELEFQFEKVELIQAYMESYEHISDPLEQQRLIQIIVDLMAKRPRLNLDATYFRDSYDIEIQCLRKHSELMRLLIVNQMKIENEENKRTQAYLDLTYRIVNEQVKGKWTYADAEDFFNELKKRKATQTYINASGDAVGTAEKDKNDQRSTGTQNSKNNQNNNMDSPTKDFLSKISEKRHTTKFSQANQLKEETNDPNQDQGFAAVLGLPPITVESLYMQYKEKDETIIDIMNENANYIRIYEGYPDFLIQNKGLNSTKLSQYQFSDWSFPINILDFYESLNFVTKFYATIQATMTELQEVLKPHENSFLACIELKLLERSQVEYQKVKAFLEGDLQEYKGSQYLEDESIVGNSDKITFYVKDFISHLQKTLKPNIDPFYLGKLDVETINFFDFTPMSKDMNPYIKERPQIQEDMSATVKIADSHVKQNVATYQRFFPQLKEYMRKINIPSMLILYCNSIEMLRLRQELIFAISESMLLQETYESQCKMVNRTNFKVLFSDQINFDNHLNDQSKVNFIDDGPGKYIDYDIAITEFDNVLKSNLNFRSADAVKMLICTSGLEELRAILHYQLMQKQLLIIGVRLNQLLMDTQVRALNELELVKKGYALPNMIIRLQNVLSRSGEGFSQDGFQKERYKYQSNLQGEVAPLMYQITSRKAKLRNTVSKKFGVYLTQVSSNFTKPECCFRVLRSYKIKLLHSYCKEVLKEAYHDAMKIQSISTCQKLRTMSQLFAIDDSIIGLSQTSATGPEKPQIFKYEQSDFMENIFSAYNPSHQQETPNQLHFSKEQSNDNRIPALSYDNLQIIDYFMIPSSSTLAKCDAISYEEIAKIQQKCPSFDFKAHPEENEPEDSIKELVPLLKIISQEYPKEDPDKDRNSIRVVDFNESYDYSETHYGQMYMYYALLERIFNLEYFVAKMTSNLLDSMKLEQCAFNGLQFWSVDPQFEAEAQKLQLNNNEKAAERILNKIVAEKRAKVNLADDIINLSSRLFIIIGKIQKSINTKVVDIKSNIDPHFIPKNRILEYLITYHEFKYYKILHLMDKLLDSYYSKGCAKEIKFVQEVYNALIKRDHIKTTYKHNSFHVNSAFTRPEMFSLESSNFYNYYGNQEEVDGFLQSIQPIINEQAMTPSQITLYEGLYMNQKYRSTQFAGQIPHYPRIYTCLETGLINFSEQERQYITSTIYSIRTFLKDYLEVMFKEAIDFSEEGFSLDNLKKCKKIILEFIQAKQLKQALICWLSCSTIPLDPQLYNQFLTQYKNDIFWKILNEKDKLASSTQHIIDSKNQQQIKGGQFNKEMNKKSEQNMLISQQLAQMQTQVLIDQVLSCRAEITVLQNEIERQIINSAVKAVEQETAALASCFQLNTKQIDMHIHPFQQFASTCYQDVDPNSHLDLVNKVSEVQKFITKLRNRGTEVETLTSGPGMVFTIKDFNECIQILCRGLIKYAEREMRSRSEDLAKKEAHYIQLLYYKDRKIENLEHRITNTRDNLDKLINSKMYEKGNQLIYELDCVNRQLRLFKDNIFQLERELRSTIRAEFAETLRRNMRDLDISWKRFKDFKNDVTSKVKADLAQEQSNIQKIIKKKAEEFKNLSVVPVNQARQQLQVRLEQAYSPGKGGLNDSRVILESEILDELNNLSEKEAREELAHMIDLMRKFRIFWKTKEILMSDKYEKEIFSLKKQLTSNACLWEQLAEGEKREKVLKQELVFTQQSLAASEKVIEKLKDDLRKSEADRIRLNQYKTNKSQRLEELEGKVRKFEVMENINLEKLIDALGNKEKEVSKLKDIEKNFNQRVDAVEKKKDQEIRDIKGQYQKEIHMKKDVLERLEGLRMELRMLEKNEGSMAEVWKAKCKELVEICNKLKSENELYRQKMTQVAQIYQQQEQLNQDSQDYQYVDNQVTFPKLINNQNYNKMMNNIQASKYGSVGHSRHSSTIKKELLNQGISLERSLIGPPLGMGDVSTNISKTKEISSSHMRGRSFYDPTQSQSKMSEASITKHGFGQQKGQLATQRFAIMGQQIAQAKASQSVRTSQIGGAQFRMNDDINNLVNTSNQNMKAFKESIAHISNTNSSFTQNINNLSTAGRSNNVGQIQDQKYEQQNNRNKSRLSQDRYNEGDKKSSRGKKASNQDLNSVAQTVYGKDFINNDEE